MLELATPLEWVLAGLIVFVGAAVQGSIGVGFAIVAAPLLAIINPAFVPVPILLATPLITIGSLLRERTHLDLRGSVAVMAGRVPGAAIGVWLLAVATTQTLSIVIGTVVLLAVFALGAGVIVPLNRLTKFTAGVVSGALGASTSIGGPPLALLYSRTRGPEVRATLGAVFTFGLVINISALALAGHIDRDALLRAAGLMGPVVAGFLSSSWVKGHFDGDRLRRTLLTAAAISAIALLVKAASG